MAAAAALCDSLTGLGPFFALRIHPLGTEPGSPWQPMSRPLLQVRVTAVGDRLAETGGRPPGSVEPRVAASVAHLGLAARLLSPALAAAVLHDRILAPGLAELRWQPVIGGPIPLSLPESAVTDSPAGPPEHLADELSTRLLDGPLRELADAMEVFSVSRHILWGNTASALNGAAAMITASRPDLAARTRALTSLLLARPPLHGTATTADGGAFRRRSCCLIYRVAPGRKGPLCGDCALAR